jgi:hypothetical protein
MARPLLGLGAGSDFEDSAVSFASWSVLGLVIRSRAVSSKKQHGVKSRHSVKVRLFFCQSKESLFALVAMT